MPVTLQMGETDSVVSLEGAVDIGSAAELKRLLIEALQAGKEVQVSLERATALDITAVQLLWAAERAAGKSEIGFRFASPLAEEISSALESVGLEAFQVTQKIVSVSGAEPCQA